MIRLDQIDMFEEPVKVRYSRYMRAIWELRCAEEANESFRGGDDYNLGYYDGVCQIMSVLFPDVRWGEVI